MRIMEDLSGQDVDDDTLSGGDDEYSDVIVGTVGWPAIYFVIVIFFGQARAGLTTPSVFYHACPRWSTPHNRSGQPV